MKKYLLIGILSVLAVSVIADYAGMPFEHAFDRDRRIRGHVPPKGFKCYGIELRATGIDTRRPYSAPNSAFMRVDFSQESWGAIMLSDPGEWDLQNTILSVAVRTDKFIRGPKGVIGFKLVDSSGVEYRTDDADLFKPTKSWAVFAQSVTDITQAETGGRLDLSNIVQVGILVLDPGTEESEITFHIDDFTAERPDTVANK